jgi:sRNA-binding regulator protein Hfq
MNFLKNEKKEKKRLKFFFINLIKIQIQTLESNTFSNTVNFKRVSIPILNKS